MAPAAVVASSWTGFYVGVHGGGAWGHSRSTNVPPSDGFDEGAVPTSVSVNPTGWLAGVQAGYNYQVNNWLFGLEGEFGYLGLKRRVEIIPDPDNFAEVKYSWYGTFTARLGLAMDRWLAYVKGGLAVARITNEAGDLVDGSNVVDLTDVTSKTRTRAGWAAGGGIEHAIAAGWSIKAEYLYMDFGKDQSTNASGDVFEHYNRVHTAKVGINRRFGSP
jgi:outer membrane immunogenic protein